MQTKFKQIVARLRQEGNAVVFSIPLAVREQLGIKSGDLVAVSVYDGNLVARKVDLSHVIERMSAGTPKAGAR